MLMDQMAHGVAVGVQKVKSAGSKVVPVAVGLGLVGSRAMAQSAAFDYTTFNSTLTTGAVAVGTAAAALAAILAGVTVWRKIVKYFNRGG